MTTRVRFLLNIMARSRHRERRRTGQYDDRNNKQFGYRFETRLYAFYEVQMARAAAPGANCEFAGHMRVGTTGCIGCGHTQGNIGHDRTPFGFTTIRGDRVCSVTWALPGDRSNADFCLV
jgi:hypothetical protein